MKILTVYSSLTGNTEKIAKAISEALPGSQLKKLPTDVNPQEYDLIFCGFWCDKGHPDELWEEFFKNIGSVPTAVFGTLGGGPNSERGRAFASKVLERISAPNILGLSLWQGKVDPKILEMMAKMPGAKPMTPERKAKLAEAAKHPTPQDLGEAAEWALCMRKAVEK